jgi:hypothetical protein
MMIRFTGSTTGAARRVTRTGRRRAAAAARGKPGAGLEARVFIAACDSRAFQAARTGLVGINARGTIVGNDLDARGVEHDFLGTPTAAS